MGLLYIDDFDSYTSLQLKWDYYYFKNQFVIASGIGRTGNNALQINSYDFSNTYTQCIGPSTVDYEWNYTANIDLEQLGLTKTIPETNDIILGFACRTYVQDDGHLNIELILDDTVQSIVKISNEEISFADSGNNILATHDNYDTLNRKLWYHQQWGFIEVYVQFSSTGSGTVSIKANEYLAYTGTLNTTVSGNSINKIRFYLDHGTFTDTEYMRIDDFYIANTSGTVNNNFLGNIYVSTLYPTQSGTYSDFTLSSGTASGTPHYEQVDNNYLIPDTTTYSGTYWISDGSDDGVWTPTRSWSYEGRTTPYIGFSRYNNDFGWVRFRGVDIPRKAKITKADLYMTQYLRNSENLYNLVFYGHNVGYSDPSIIIDSADDWIVLPRTEIIAKHSFANVGTNIAEIMDVKEVLQQLVNRADWRETNNVFTLLMFEDYWDGNNYYHVYYAWEYDDVNGTSYRPRIEIEWELPYYDSEYLQTTSTGISETFNYDTTSISGSEIIGLQHNVFTGHEDYSAYVERMYKTEKSVVSGTEYDNSLFQIPGSVDSKNPAFGYKISDYNPQTNARWTKDELSLAEFGITTLSGYYDQFD